MLLIKKVVGIVLVIEVSLVQYTSFCDDNKANKFLS